LREWLAEQGATARDLFADAAGLHIVFATAAALEEDDTNGVSDIYLYQTGTEQVSLISRAWDGSAADGPSTHPRIDGSGDYIVYQSAADNLVLDDHNAVLDVYLYDLWTGMTERVSWGVDDQEAGRPSRNPAIGGDGPRVLYDREDERARRQVYGFDPRQPGLGTHPMSLPENDQGQSVESHHPGISEDGRFITYLETVVATENAPATCAVHI
jgi:hypothetical protein